MNKIFLIYHILYAKHSEKISRNIKLQTHDTLLLYVHLSTLIFFKVSGRPWVITLAREFFVGLLALKKTTTTVVMLACCYCLMCKNIRYYDTKIPQTFALYARWTVMLVSRNRLQRSAHYIRQENTFARTR